MALTSKLSAIGDAIRSKTGTSDLITLDDMPSVIEGIETGGDIPTEGLNYTGDCSNMFINENHNWIINLHGDKINTVDIDNATNMFLENSTIEKIPFDFNFIVKTPIDDTQNRSDCTYCYGMFYCATALKEIGAIRNLKPADMSNMFAGCSSLRYLPEFENLDLSKVKNADQMLTACWSLREIPSYLTNSKAAPYFIRNLSEMFALDEAVDLYPDEETLTSNKFSAAFYNLNRVKRITFATLEDGTPYTRSWKNQTIDLTYPKSVGYVEMTYENNIYDNFETNGLSYDGYVTDDAQYAALKDTDYWWTPMVEYSRFDVESAYELIKSLPDTSAYGTNTLKLFGMQGTLSGGSCDSLSAEQIATATEKGWTVSFRDY